MVFFEEVSVLINNLSQELNSAISNTSVVYDGWGVILQIIEVIQNQNLRSQDVTLSNHMMASVIIHNVRFIICNKYCQKLEAYRTKIRPILYQIERAVDKYLEPY